MPRKNHVILIGSGGTGTAFAALMSLRRHWDDSVQIVLMDTNPGHLVSGSLLADAFEQVPPSIEPRFSDLLPEIIVRYGVDTYMPLIDTEIVLSTHLREEGVIPAQVHVFAPSLKATECCVDKLLAHRLFEAYDLPTPSTYKIGDQPSSESWFMKPRRGFGSRGAHQIASDKIDQLTEQECKENLLQEICSGPEVTVDVFRAGMRKLFRAVCRERIETKAGVCTKARVHSDESLELIAARLGDVLDIQGGFCFQVMHRRNGTRAITDINTRLGAGTALSVAAGYDFFAAVFASAWGLDPSPFLPEVNGEVFITRQYSEFVMRRNG
jgi:carbamoylphosphate synthase large subunit